jgi:hypothetical protein
MERTKMKMRLFLKIAASLWLMLSLPELGGCDNFWSHYETADVLTVESSGTVAREKS